MAFWNGTAFILKPKIKKKKKKELAMTSKNAEDAQILFLRQIKSYFSQIIFILETHTYQDN